MHFYITKRNVLLTAKFFGNNPPNCIWSSKKLSWITFSPRLTKIVKWIFCSPNMPCLVICLILTFNSLSLKLTKKTSKSLKGHRFEPHRMPIVIVAATFNTIFHLFLLILHGFICHSYNHLAWSTVKFKIWVSAVTI